MQYGIYIGGASAEAIIQASETILAIMIAPAGDIVKAQALCSTFVTIWTLSLPL